MYLDLSRAFCKTYNICVLLSYRFHKIFIIILCKLLKFPAYTHTHIYPVPWRNSCNTQNSRMHFIHQSTAAESTLINKFNPNQRHKYSIAYDASWCKIFKNCIHPFCWSRKRDWFLIFFFFISNCERMALVDKLGF